MLDSPMRRASAANPTADSTDVTGLASREESGSERLMGVERSTAGGGSTRGPLIFLFAAMGLAVAGTVGYTVATDGAPFRPELLTPWMVATLVDCYVAFLCCYAWIFYKEQSWLARAAWLLAVLCTGSIAITLYIVLQLWKSRGRTTAHLLTARGEPEDK